MIEIGQLSKRTGVHIETIRYYERIKLLPKAARTARGRRTYGAADVFRLNFIRRARDMGFALKSIRVLLALQERPNVSCASATKLASVELAAVEVRLQRLLKLRDDLSAIVHGCTNESASECSVLSALGHGLVDQSNRLSPTA